MKFKFALTAIARPYLEIEADSLDAAKTLIENEKFSREQREQLLDTSWPFSNIEIDEIYDADDRRIREDEDDDDEEEEEETA